MNASQIVKIADDDRGIPRRRVYELLREAKRAELLQQLKREALMKRSRIRSAEIKARSPYPGSVWRPL